MASEPYKENYEELMARPSFEEAEPGYLELLAKIRDEISRMQPGMSWSEPTPQRSTETLCGRKVDGHAFTYTAGFGSQAVKEESWDAIYSRVHEIAQSEGFTYVVMLANKQGQHTMDFINPKYGDRILFNTDAKDGFTSLVLFGACYLLEADRGKPPSE